MMQNAFKRAIFLAALGLLVPTTALGSISDGEVDLDGDGELTSKDVFAFVSQWHALIESSTPDSGEEFSILDYYVLTPGSTWTFGTTGKGLLDNGFTWTVLEELVDIGGGVLVRAIRTTGFQTDFTRHLDEDFWSVDESSGRLFFHGIRESVGFSLKGLDLGIEIPPQDFIIEPAVDFGGVLEIGETLSTTAELAVLAEIPPFGQQVIGATAFATVRYEEKIPVFATELGDFTDVIRLNVNIKTVVRIGLSELDFEFLDNNFFLKEGVGVVGVDLDPSPNSDNLLTLVEGTVYVDGAPVVITPE